MIKRPKPGEDEDDLLRMQEEFLKEKSKDPSLKPAAQVTNLRRTEPTKRCSTSTSDAGTRKPSKYAQSRGLQNSEKRVRFENETSFIMGDILEKNIEELPQTRIEDDKVYYPTVIPSLLGEILERNVDQFMDFNIKFMPSEGFPVATKREPNIKLGKMSINALESEMVQINKLKLMQMDIEELSSFSLSNTQNQTISKPNLPTKSFILSSKEANEIHNENVKTLSKLSEKEILEEKQKLLSSLDPKLVEFLKARRKEVSSDTANHSDSSAIHRDNIEESMETDSSVEPQILGIDTLWENDVLSHPQVHNWLHFDSLEKDKLEWMKGIEESKVKANEPYEARFDFKGYLLPYTMNYTEDTKTLFHHGEEPHRPGYSLTELFELSRSTILQQRVMALNTIAGVLEYYSAGTYKDIIDIPLSKIFFVVRIAMDENKATILEPALKAMRNLLYNRIDEACLDALLGFKEGTQQPCLENDKSEIEELESKESELKDFHLAEIDIITAVLRTEIIQRLYYVLQFVKPSFNCVQYSLQILTRLARDSLDTSIKIVESDHLMRSVIRNFIPITSVNFAFEPQIVYNGKPVLAAVKLLRVLSLQSKEIGEILVSKYDILKPSLEYVSSGVDGTYGLRIQMEAFCVLSNLIHFGIGIENALSLSPIIATTLYKHIQGTDVLVNSSIISATHAAVVLQFVNKLLNCKQTNLDSFKQQMYPLIKGGLQKWLTQLSSSEKYTCAHLRLICAVLDCYKTILVSEKLPIKFLYDSLKSLSISCGFREVINNLIPSSNLLSEVKNKELHLTKNLMCLGGLVIDSAQKVLPVLNVTSPLPLLESLFNLLILVNEREVTDVFVEHVTPYLWRLANKTPSLCDNWFTRIETDFVFSVVKLSTQNDMPESKKDLLYVVANKLCYILRNDNKYELEFLFNKVVFNKQWFSAERLLNLVSLSDADGFSKALTSIEDIKLCYSKVINLNHEAMGPNVVLRKWQEPILPRDWIYLPILSLYSKSQEGEMTPKVIGENANKVTVALVAEKALIISCSLEWILFNELCFPDLLDEIDVTDRFCRLMCVFLCDNSLFLDSQIKLLLHKCSQLLFRKRTSFNFDKQLTGLHNFQDLYTQFLEQFQSVSYGDHIFAACVLVPLTQKHNVKWRKLLWSEYAGCLRALDCPEELLCYQMDDYCYPEETDDSVIKSYFQALSSNLLRPNTIAHKIASHHVQAYQKRMLQSTP